MVGIEKDPRCVFVSAGPVRCSEEATSLVEHRYGRGWYCDDHALWVRDRWVPEPEDVPDLIVLTKQSSLPDRRPVFNR